MRSSLRRRIYLASFGVFQNASSLFADLFRQSTFITWSLSLSFLQLLEVIVLTEFHYVHLSPVGLQILRLLSTLSLISPLIAFYLRFKSPPDRSEEGRRWSEFLFFWSAVLSALSLVLIHTSTLHLSSSNAFRAVLVSGLLLLPLDLANTSLLYSRPIYKSSWGLKSLRKWSILLLIASLFCLAADYVLLFLLLKASPRIWLFFKLREEAASTWLPRWRIPSTIPKGVLVFFLFDLSLFAWSLRLSGQDPETSFLIFALHKLVHFSTLLGIKSQMGGRQAILLAKKGLWKFWNFRLVIHQVIFLPIVGIFFFFLHARSLAQISPHALGDPVQLSFLGSLLLGGVVISRSLVGPLWLCVTAPPGPTKIRVSSFFIWMIPWATYLGWPFFAIPYLSSSQQLFAGAFVDLFCVLTLLILCVYYRKSFIRDHRALQSRFLALHSKGNFWRVRVKNEEPPHSSHQGVVFFGNTIVSEDPLQLLNHARELGHVMRADEGDDLPTRFRKLYGLHELQIVQESNPMDFSDVLEIPLSKLREDSLHLSDEQMKQLFDYLRLFLKFPALIDMSIWSQKGSKGLFHTYRSPHKCSIFILPKEKSSQVWSYRYWAFQNSLRSFS